MLTVFQNKNLLQYIFQFLDPKSLCKCMQTSTHWCTNARSDLVWKRHKDRIESVFSVQFMDIRPIYTQFGSLFNIDFLNMDNLYLIRDIYTIQIPARHRDYLEIRSYSLPDDDTCYINVNLKKSNLTIHIQTIDWNDDHNIVLNAYYNVVFDVTNEFDMICPKWLML